MALLQAITPLRALGMLLGWNYLRHLRSRNRPADLRLSTVCSEGRELLPVWAFALGWAAFNRWFIPHWINGYRHRI